MNSWLFGLFLLKGQVDVAVCLWLMFVCCFSCIRKVQCWDGSFPHLTLRIESACLVKKKKKKGGCVVIWGSIHHIASFYDAIWLKYVQYQATPTWWQGRNIHLKWQLLLHRDHTIQVQTHSKSLKIYWETFSALKGKYSFIGLFSCACEAFWVNAYWAQGLISSSSV